MNENKVEQFRVQIRKFVRELEKKNIFNSCYGVTVVQCHALLEIEQQGKCQLNELAGALELDKSTVSRTVNGLVKNGMVDRIIPESNRRTSILQLTELGKKTCKRLNQDNDTYFIEALNAIPEAYRENFLLNFEIFTTKMEELNTPKITD